VLFAVEPSVLITLTVSTTAVDVPTVMVPKSVVDELDVVTVNESAVPVASVKVTSKALDAVVATTVPSAPKPEKNSFRCICCGQCQVVNTVNAR